MRLICATLIVIFFSTRSHASGLVDGVCGPVKHPSVMRSVLKMIVPKPPAGLPLEKAKECTNRMKIVADYFLENFYDHFTSEQTGKFNAYEINSKVKAEQIESKLKEIRPKGSGNECIISDSGVDNREVLGLYAQSLSLLHFSENGIDNFYLVFATKEDLASYVGAKFTSKMDEIRASHVLVLPKNILKGLSLDDNSSEKVPYSISWTLEQSDGIWSGYLAKYTAVKKIKAKDLSTIDYEISLNFDLACKSMKKKDDLLSK